MSVFSKSLLLFLLNWLDAQLTIFWVRGGYASEGNGLMAYLLERGDTPFLCAKLLIGGLVAWMLYRFSHVALARRGLRFALGLYLALMFVHLATGASALGLHAPEAVASVLQLPSKVCALFS